MTLQEQLEKAAEKLGYRVKILPAGTDGGSFCWEIQIVRKKDRAVFCAEGITWSEFLLQGIDLEKGWAIKAYAAELEIDAPNEIELILQYP